MMIFPSNSDIHLSGNNVISTCIVNLEKRNRM